MKSFEIIYSSFKSHYIANNGSNKFEKIHREIIESKKVREAFEESARRQISISGTDIFGLIFLLPYFIIAKNETRAMGALVALKFWNESVNRNYTIADKDSVYHKVQVIMHKFSLQEFL